MKKNYLSVLISMPPDIRSFTKTKHKKDEGKSYKDEFIRILNVLIHVFLWLQKETDSAVCFKSFSKPSYTFSVKKR